MGLESQDTRGQIFQADLISFEVEPPYSAEGGRISKGSVTLPNFGGSVLFMRVPFATELPNLTSNTYMWGRGVYLGLSHASLPNRAEFQRSPVLEVLYLSLHPLTRNNQIRQGNTNGERCDLIS